MKTTLEPEYIPDEGDIANLSSVVVMPGFQVLKNIMRSECDKMIMALVNADVGNSAEIVAKHGIARAAAIFYSELINHINELTDIHRSIISAQGKPVDPTEGMIDLGDLEIV